MRAFPEVNETIVTYQIVVEAPLHVDDVRSLVFSIRRDYFEPAREGSIYLEFGLCVRALTGKGKLLRQEAERDGIVVKLGEMRRFCD